MIYVRNQVHEKRDTLRTDMATSFLQFCEDAIVFAGRVLNIHHPKFQIKLSDANIQTPTDKMRASDICDPMTLDSLVSETIYGLLKEHFVASKDVVEEMI